MVSDHRAVAPPAVPPIEVLDHLSAGIFAAAMAPLFEGAPRFLGRLANARPFGSLGALFEAARRVAHDMPAAEQVELVDAHPRLGAPPARMSAMSVEEQARGDRPAGAAATEAATLAAAVERSRLAAELDRLNAAYEARFGFRYCVFVAGRTLAELLPGIAASLEADRASELARAIDAVVDIARDRAGRLGGATTRRIE